MSIPKGPQSLWSQQGLSPLGWAQLPRSPPGCRNCVLVTQTPSPSSEKSQTFPGWSRVGTGTVDPARLEMKLPTFPFALGHKRVFSTLRGFAGFVQRIQEQEGLKSCSPLPLKDSISVLSSNHDSEHPIPLPDSRQAKSSQE